MILLRNILKYTIGLPIILMFTVTFPIMILFEILLKIVFDDFDWVIFELITDLWKPIKE